jgi:homoserine kinase
MNKGLVSDGSSISMVDLNLTCSDTKFQKNTIAPAGSAVYLKNENFKKAVLEKAFSLYSKLTPFRKVTTDELREKLGLGSSGGSAVGGPDLTDEDFSGVLGNV